MNKEDEDMSTNTTKVIDNTTVIQCYRIETHDGATVNMQAMFACDEDTTINGAIAKASLKEEGTLEDCLLHCVQTQMCSSVIWKEPSADVSGCWI